MCGIAGIVAKQTPLALVPILKSLSDSLKHRGPDGEGFMLATPTQTQAFTSDDTPNWSDNQLPYLRSQKLESVLTHTSYQLGLAHRRLAIIDLTASGHQPLCDLQSKYWITFNGEIYNYLELKQELSTLGHTFFSSSDTEVLVKAYQQWGQACLQKLNGMWAFCIYDMEKQILFCSRDRLGVKPFYFCNSQQHFSFASEQKAFVKSGIVKAQMNTTALHDYLINGRLEQSQTNFFEGIEELFPGNNLVYDLKNHKYVITPYYSVSNFQTKLYATETELIEKVFTTFNRAVELRLRSDVEVGTCLSGGIDSSSIAVLMAKHSSQAIHCFTADFKEGKGGEGHFAAEVAQQIKAKHHICLPTQEELFNDLESLTYALDAPTWDTSTYAQFRVMRLAKENNIKVVLDGQGADELFAGYHHHYIPYWNKLSFLTRFSKMNEAKRTIENPILFYYKEQIKQYFNLQLRSVSELFTKDFVQSQKVVNPTQYKNSVNDQLQYDIEHARLKTFLRCEDRCGMWHSVESRTPFSDDSDLIELAFSMDGQQKIKNGTLKYLLREAMKNDLPKTIYNRYDKMGFTTPMQHWLTSKKQILLSAVLDRKFEFVNNITLTNAIKKENPSFIHLSVLYKLYLLILWEKVFS
jgi:asparagine synthase (glutamine-hydrolysing)